MKNGGGNNEPRNNEPAVVIQDLRKSFGRQKVLNGIGRRSPAARPWSCWDEAVREERLIKIVDWPPKAGLRFHSHPGAGNDDFTVQGVKPSQDKDGVLVPTAALYDSLSVEENVAFPDRHSDLPVRSEKSGSARYSRQSGWSSMERSSVADLRGMQKRVGLARALALDPEIMLLDEPTAGLDPITASEINRLILCLQEKRKITSIVVTHDVHGARTVSDRLVLLKEGSIAAEGTFEELKKNQELFVAQFLSGDS